MIETNLIPEISGIYKFINIINNKVYIGQGLNLQVRIKGHIRDYKNNKINYYFYNTIRKHGIENFKFEILQEGNFNQDELNQMEICYIRLFKSNNQLYGYNMTAGGDGISGFKHSDETKQKISKIHKGKIISQEQKKKVSEFHKGKVLSEETKEKMRGKIISEETRKKLKSRIVSEETKEKIRNSVKYRKPITQETKDKMSKAKKGKKHSEEHKEKIKNRIISEETRKKLSECHKGKKLKPEHIEKREKTRKFNKFKKQLIELFYIELMKI